MLVALTLAEDSCFLKNQEICAIFVPAKKSRRFSSLGGDLKLGGALGKVGEMDNTGGGEPDTQHTIDVLKCLRCGQEGCTNVPGFGYPGEGPTLCSEHATPVMEQIVPLRCEHADCNARRTFGYDGAAARLCAAHKLDGMVDLMKRRSQVGEVARKHLTPSPHPASALRCCTLLPRAPI